MKKRRILGIIISICILLEGCGADIEKIGVSRQELQPKEAVAESTLGDTESGKGAEQTEEDAEKEEAPLPIISYATAYQRFLEAYVEENEYAHRARVMLVLIDDDNVPELLLIEDESHASGVKVYTYYQGAVIELGEFGSFGSMQYMEKGGMIFSGYSGMGEGSSMFFQVEDGEAKLVCSMMNYQPFDESPETYEIDGISVTQEAFQKKWKEMYDTGEYVVIRYDDALAIGKSELADLLAEAQNTLILQKESARLADMVAGQAEVLEGYGAFLTEYVPHRTESDSKEVPGFALIYLNDDDAPELIVIEGYAHACGASVYTYEKGEVIPVGVYGQYGCMAYREKDGIVFDDYDTGGNMYSNVYQIEGKKETLLQSYSERWEFPEEGEELQYTYTVDGKEVSEEQYREVCDKWYEIGDKVIDYGMCRTLTDSNMQRALTEELENLILTQEEVLKQNVLIAAGAQESNILLLDYDDYDRDGKYEAFIICGDSYDDYGTVIYRGVLYFVGADCCTLLRNDEYYHESYRMIDGKMDFGSRKYLFFYLDYVVTANISVIWTVRDGKPVEESNLFQRGQVVYRGANERNEFEIWVDAYDHECDKDYFGEGDDMWLGHTWKPYFYHYNSGSDQIEKYGGEIISGKEFEELSGTNLIEEIETEGYTVETIIRWENDIVTINYVIPENDWGTVWYENVIWDNKVKDFWKKDVRGVTSWKYAGEGGSFWL